MCYVPHALSSGDADLGLKAGRHTGPETDPWSLRDVQKKAAILKVTPVEGSKRTDLAAWGYWAKRAHCDRSGTDEIGGPPHLVHEQEFWQLYQSAQFAS